MVILHPRASESAEAGAAKLTIERMYSDPRITGITPRSLAWSPDGKTLAFIWNDEGTRFYDIWLYDAGGKKLRRATHADALEESSKAVLTRAEIDRLETFRRTGGGIYSFRWSPDGRKICFPLSGDLFVLDVRSGDVKRLFRTAASESDPKFSPDGGRISFIRDNDIWVLDLASGTTVQLTESGGETLYNGLGDYIDYEEVGRREAYWWSPDGSRIAYVQVDVSPIRELLIPDYLGTFVEVRRQLRPVAGGANGIKRLGVLNVDTRETVWIEPGVLRDEYIVQVHWHPGGGALLILAEPRHLKDLHYLKADPENGSIDTLFTVSNDRWVNVNNLGVLWDGEGEWLYYTSEESGWNHIYRMNWESGRREKLTFGDWEVTGLHVVDGKERVWYTSTEVEPQQRHLYYADASRRRYRVTPGVGWYRSVLPAKPKSAAVVYSNVKHPPDLFILENPKKIESAGEADPPKKGDRGGGHAPPLGGAGEWKVPDGLRRITDSPAADFAGLKIPEPRYFTLESRLDGETVHALLVLPPELDGIDVGGIISGGSKEEFRVRFPAIVSVHGGGYAQSVFKGWRWRALFDAYLVGRGYVILDLDYRGSSGYGRKFRTDVHLDIGGSDLEDEMTGVELLRRLPFIDPRRIGIWGWSYGGYMTTLAMLKYPDAFYAGAAVAPVNDWRNYDTHYTEERLGLPQEQPEAYRKGSPVTYADSLRNHLLMIHGMGDDNVHFQDTVQLVEALIATGVDFEVMFYPAGKHGIRADASRIHLFRKITRHFDRYLKGDPDASCP
jgi:dipeptidyl-peptidase-4